LVKIFPRETVILADDTHKLVDWYINILGFKETARYEDNLFYSNLETESGIIIGIADIKELDVKKPNRQKNTVILQIEVEDVKTFLAYIKEQEGTVVYGPSFDEKGNYWCGSFRDIEGNEIWVVDTNCP